MTMFRFQRKKKQKTKNKSVKENKKTNRKAKLYLQFYNDNYHLTVYSAESGLGGGLLYYFTR